jgi:hypothetical protein
VKVFKVKKPKEVLEKVTPKKKKEKPKKNLREKEND